MDEHGLHLDPTMIQFIHDWTTLTALTDLDKIFGLSKFYHRFLLGFSHITWPLNQVAKGGSKSNFSWAETQQKIFNYMKQCMCLVLVLAFPYLQHHFEIETDAPTMILVQYLLNMDI